MLQNANLAATNTFTQCRQDALNRAEAAASLTSNRRLTDRYVARSRPTGYGRLREFATKPVSCPSRQEPDSSKTRFRRT
jgi:hypothetical protein